MKLVDCYGTEHLENACARALSYIPSPTLKYQHHSKEWIG